MVILQPMEICEIILVEETLEEEVEEEEGNLHQDLHFCHFLHLEMVNGLMEMEENQLKLPPSCWEMTLYSLPPF